MSHQQPSLDVCAEFCRCDPDRSVESPEWRGEDLNLRPSGYEPDELPDCSTPRRRHRLYTPPEAGHGAVRRSATATTPSAAGAEARTDRPPEAGARAAVDRRAQRSAPPRPTPA